MGRLLFHAPVRFLSFENLLAVGKSNMHAFADRGLVFALKGENVCQKSLYTRIAHGRHRSRQFYNICLPDLASSFQNRKRVV